MKHIFFIFLSCFLCGNLLFAQEVIMRQNGSVSVPYYTNTTTLAQVVAAASAGDTIYLPGITFDLGTSPLVINKRLHIIGVGHYLGASNVTNQTIIVGAMNILGGASAGDGGSLTGIAFRTHTGASGELIQFGNSNTNKNLADFKFTRCLIENSLVLGYNSGASVAPFAHNIDFRECVLYYVTSLDAYNINFYNSIFNQLSNFNSPTVIINNCVGLSTVSSGSYAYIFPSCSNLTINNSIVYGFGTIVEYAGVFTNCLLNTTSSPYQGSNNVLVSVPLSTIFQNVGSGYFDYTYDYHLAPNSPAYINGVEVGIYGGNTPAKEKGIPFNPHVQNFSISGGTVTVETQAQSY